MIANDYRDRPPPVTKARILTSALTMNTRYDRLHSIQQLDPITQHQQICHLTAGYEFPWDMTRALELALLRTFCVPPVFLSCSIAPENSITIRKSTMTTPG